MVGPYHEYHEGWARLGITASEGREKGAENEGKGTGKGKGKYMWEEFREDEDVLFSQLERHVLREGSGGALARVIARVLFVYKGKTKSTSEGKGKVEVQIEGADDNNDEGGFINAAREGQAQREEPPPPIALPYDMYLPSWGTG